jgi:LysM repeat protein
VAKTFIKFLSVIVLALLVSCRAARVPVKPSVTNGNAVTYIEAYKDLAISEMIRTGVPASITLAQGMVESDYGRSSLARVANNHFGIKCHNDWDGATVRQHDDRRNECFRRYKRPEDSFYDHSDFLRSGSRYRFLFNLDPTDYKAWAHGLKRAGYATNPDYANMIIRKIEENGLYQFDRGYTASQGKLPKQKSGSESETASGAGITKPAAQKPQGAVTATKPALQEETITFGEVMAMAPRIMQNNRVQYIIVENGETEDKIENEFQVKKTDLAVFNDLLPDFKPAPGQILYLEPKRERSEPGIEFHTVSKGETMYLISQKYAVKLKSLLEMNGMTPGMEPVPGQKIWLQESKPMIN